MTADFVQPSGTEKVGRTPRKTRIGIVRSDRADKMISVECSFSVMHRKYGKLINRRTVLHAHDEKNEARIGDRVEVAECRPLSKTKNWRMLRIVERA